MAIFVPNSMPMHRSLLVILLFICSANATAQVGITPITTAKVAETPVDYKKMGAPMPQFKILKFQDSGSKNIPVSEMVANETAHKQKKKRHGQYDGGMAGTKDSKYITNNDLDNSANVLIMMFNPTCSHCEDETELLEKNMALFTKTKIVMVANPTMWDYMANFSKTYKIASYPAISLGVDSSDFISKVFLYSALPQINIYNKDRKLIKTYSGEVGIDSLKQYLQ